MGWPFPLPLGFLPQSLPPPLLVLVLVDVVALGLADK
jgi:hypothetical protein